MNKLRLLVSILFVAGVASLCCAQIKTDHGADSDRIEQNIHKLDLMVQIVPLLLTKDQFPDLLTGIENARQRQRDELKQEDQDLADLDQEVSKAIDDATQNGKAPSKAVLDDINKKYQVASTRRTMIGEKMVGDVYSLIGTKLNEGQRKAMAASFPASAMGNFKPEDVTEAVKIRYFIRMVLLDPAAYPLLLEMSKHTN